MDKIKSILKEHYDIDISTILEQQPGWAALAYKLDNDRNSYFLKVYEKSRASTAKWTALIDVYMPILEWLMHNSGLKGKVPVPLITKNGDYKYEDPDGIYLLFEFIDGQTIGDQELMEEQIIQFSEIIAELHLFGEEIPIGTDAIREDFHVPYLQLIRNLFDKEYRNLSNDIKEVIKPYIEPLSLLVDQVEKLAILLKNSNLKMVLCHTDIHNWNLMQHKKHLILIDWEGLKLAPIEADMIFFIDKPFYQKFLSIYQKAHKDFVINLDTLQFYKGRRKLEDIWECIEELLFDQQDAKERANTLDILIQELKNISN
ncbi:Phosphotransferase enzyme family protein [Seinonella peptonophila]|uniref:Phosphotransferase enzyme family protein n=1 Tax=Seinonella peptonophila TaxID=112248 RepID=A0A1M4SJW0_9BACL|nr:phosphotransferase [Seinonella peptonophila]SHE32438.1 Phosphotransferase enzyme family protein [Seinonella peptonophila]